MTASGRVGRSGCRSVSSHTSGTDRGSCAERDISPAVAMSDRHDDCCRQGGCRRHGTDDQVTGAAEQRIQDQRWGGGIKTYDGRQAGDAGVRQGLGHQHRPHRQAGDKVPTAAKLADNPGVILGLATHVLPSARGHAAIPMSIICAIAPGRSRPFWSSLTSRCVGTDEVTGGDHPNGPVAVR